MIGPMTYSVLSTRINGFYRVRLVRDSDGATVTEFVQDARGDRAFANWTDALFRAQDLKRMLESWCPKLVEFVPTGEV